MVGCGQGEEGECAEELDAGESLNQARVVRLVGGGECGRLDEQYAGEREVTAAQLCYCESGVVDGAEGVAGDEEERKSEGSGEVRGGEIV